MIKNIFLSDKVLGITNSIENLGGLNFPLVMCLLLAWYIVFLALVKGVQSLGKS